MILASTTIPDCTLTSTSDRESGVPGYKKRGEEVEVQGELAGILWRSLELFNLQRPALQHGEERGERTDWQHARPPTNILPFKADWSKEMEQRIGLNFSGKVVQEATICRLPLQDTDIPHQIYGRILQTLPSGPNVLRSTLMLLVLPELNTTQTKMVGDDL